MFKVFSYTENRYNLEKDWKNGYINISLALKEEGKKKKVSTLGLFIIREERKALPGFQFSVIIPYNNKVKFQWFLWHLFPSLTYHKRLTFSTLYAISQSLALNLNDEKIKKIAGSVWISVPTDAYKMVYRYCSSLVMTV